MAAVQHVVERVVIDALTAGARILARAAPLHHAVFDAYERRLRRRAAAPSSHIRHPPAVEADRFALSAAMLRLVERALAEDRLSPAARRGLLQRLVHDVLLRRGGRSAKTAFVARHGCGPPDFLTVSPGKACNLRCVGCYARSGPTHAKLDWPTFDRIVSEARDLWGVRFFVLSGGEPFAYRDQGKGILDLAQEHPDCFFLTFTNGTLIGDDEARRMAELGNLSPGVSLEGGRERTDARRGGGVYDKVVAAVGRLRRAQVVFGVSLTATRENAEEILSDELVDLYFGKLGALYAWVFHYMPIGSEPSLDLIVTPEQRLRLQDRVWSLVRDRQLLIADFWNCGTATNGCVAGARPGGYLYVDWNGAVCPCVFVPYSPVNVHDVYARGGTLDDVWPEPLFAGIRAWQRRYGYREDGEAYGGNGNWLMPCLIRDHHDVFRGLVAQHRPQPADEPARAALADPSYAEGLADFDRKLAELTDPVWQSCYLASMGAGSGDDGAGRRRRRVP
jgi:MoaA/NifB/PqqE/SkfB family radical SAM enzyme